jgi:hypothetical protein
MGAMGWMGVFDMLPTFTEKVQAQETDITSEEEPALSVQETPVEKAIRLIPHTQDETERRIRYLYERAGEHADVLARIIWCESRFLNVQSQVQQHYGQELSFGLAQIHLPSHPNVTKEQAMDAYFSIDYAIELYKKEGARPWYGYSTKTSTCSYKNGQEYWL